MKANYKYKTIPFDHQTECVYKIYPHDFGAGFMEMGTGKTKTFIDIVSNKYLEGKINAVLLIAPNLVHTQWETEQIPEHSPVDYIVKSWDNTKSKSYNKELEQFIVNKEKKLKWFCVNVEAFSSKNHIELFKDFVKQHDTAIILDEATTIKNPTANRTFNITYNLGEITKNRQRVTMSLPYSKYRYILTGTMITNSPFDLYSMFEFLKYNFFGMNYYAFKSRYGIERSATVANSNIKYNRNVNKKEIEWIRDMHNRGYAIPYISSKLNMPESNVLYILNNPDLTSPYKNLEELKAKIFPYSFIVRKKDCLDLPAKVYEKLPVQMNKEQQKVYRDLEKDFLSQHDHKTLSVQNKLTLLTRLSQITGGFLPYQYSENENGDVVAETGLIALKNSKLEALKRDLEETDEKIIIFARFTAEIELITVELSKSFPDKVIKSYYGITSIADRMEIQEDFKKGNIDILVANQACAGIGLNLQVAHLVYYFSNSYSLYYRSQSEDRIHRLGQKETCVYKDIIAVGTVDEKIYKALCDKKDLLEYFRENTLEDFILEY